MTEETIETPVEGIRTATPEEVKRTNVNNAFDYLLNAIDQEYGQLDAIIAKIEEARSLMTEQTETVSE